MANFVHDRDEGDLVRRAQQGDADAFTELYRRHVDQIYRFVYLRVGDEAAAEDLTSEVFVRALESLHAYEDRGAPFAAWLYRIANARVVDHWRRSRQVDVSLDSGEIELPFEPAARDVFALKILSESLRRLTAEQQEVIILKFVEGYSTAEISQITGRSEGAVKALQRRALASLARHMDS